MEERLRRHEISETDTDECTLSYPDSPSDEMQLERTAAVHAT